MKNERASIRAYFVDLKINVIIKLLLLAILLLMLLKYLPLGLHRLRYAGLIPLLYYIGRYLFLKERACSDKEYDQYLERDIENLRELVMSKINVSPDEILNQFNIIASYKVENKGWLKDSLRKSIEVPFILRKKGMDTKYRDTPLIFQTIFCLENKLIITVTKLDVLTGNILDTTTNYIYFDEVSTYYLKDNTEKQIVPFQLWLFIKKLLKPNSQTTEENPNIQQANIREENTSRFFVIESRGGKLIKITLPSVFFIENVADNAPHTSQEEQTIAAIQKLLDDKK